MIVVTRTPVRNPKDKLRSDTVTIDGNKIFHVYVGTSGKYVNDHVYDVFVLAKGYRAAERIALESLAHHDKAVINLSEKLRVISRIK